MNQRQSTTRTGASPAVAGRHNGIRTGSAGASVRPAAMGGAAHQGLTSDCDASKPGGCPGAKRVIHTKHEKRRFAGL